jgi:tRNA (guanine37-N1)-methyltransferase
VRIDVISVLPDVFEPYASSSMLGIAREKGALDLAVHDLRAWALPGVHRQVDDAPYGGGFGMVLRPEPFFDAVRAVTALDERAPLVVLMSPQGEPFTQEIAEDLSHRERLLVLCGRYEGFDERIRTLADTELSVGDFVLTGGELPALTLIDAVARLLPGVLGGAGSADEESFSGDVLEYPQYTRPALFEGLAVPDVLLSGDHGRVARWRREQALDRTARRRPDLIRRVWDDLTDSERARLGTRRDDETESA